MRLEGKVVLISGGARGMGAVEAKLFAREGAAVVIGDILEKEGRAVEAEIQKAGGKAVFVRLDVTSESDWQRAVATTESRFGKLDVVVNNAGVSVRGRLEEVTVEEWDRVMAINAKGVFLGTKAAIPALRCAGGGSIVNIPPSSAWSAPIIRARSTRLPRARCASSPRRPPSSTRRRESARTPSTRGRS